MKRNIGKEFLVDYINAVAFQGAEALCGDVLFAEVLKEELEHVSPFMEKGFIEQSKGGWITEAALRFVSEEVGKSMPLCESVSPSHIRMTVHAVNRSPFFRKCWDEFYMHRAKPFIDKQK